MRYFRENKHSVVQFCGMFGIEKMEVRTPSLVDAFYFETSEDPECVCEVVSYSHPLYMALNQQRLNRLGPAAVQQWLEQLDRAGNSSYHELKSKIKDSDLLKLVKPRECQSPSELESYLNYLNEHVEAFNNEVARIVAEEKEQQQMQQQTIAVSEPQKTE